MAKKKTTDPKVFNPDQYQKWLAPASLAIQQAITKGKMLACIVSLLFLGINLPAQNRALVTSPDYVIFRYGADTLDTALLPAFLLNACKLDTALACDQAKRCVLFLHSNPYDVDRLDKAMLKAYGRGMLAYVLYYRKREKEELERLKK